MTRVRVVTYNAHALPWTGSGVVRVLRELDPDVVCLQQVATWPGWRGRCAALARRSHLLYAGGGGTTAGTVLLTAARVDVRAVWERRLRRTPGLASRGVVLGALRKGRARLAVASFQLGLDPAERARHLTDITGLVHRLRYPTDGEPALPVAVVAGGLNETSRASTWSRLAMQYVDAGAGDEAATFPADRPRERIDGIFVRGAARVESCRVLESAAGYHRPVVADLTLHG